MDRGLSAELARLRSQLAEGGGVAGPQGPAGAPGADGADGADGASAYEVAVANGFVGTEVAWLASLVGADGADGAPGATGATGPAGPTGPTGPAGVDGADGLNGDPGAQGIQGIQGPAGPAGADGADGTTIGLLSANRSSSSQTITTSFAAFVWDTPGLNQDGWTYAGGTFTVPASINGRYLEFNINLMHDSTNVGYRAQLLAHLQKDAGAGFVTVAEFSNYTARNTDQNEGGINLSGFIDPTAAVTGDRWRVMILRRGRGESSSTEGCHLSIKSYS